MTTMTCGEALLRLLKAYGVDTVFGIPGYHTVEFYRNFDQVGLRQVTPRHEQGSAYGALGYALATGKPGACFLVTGPGLTNASTAIGEAYGNSVPMLVFTTMNQTHELGMGGGRMHELRSQGDIIAQVTAFSHTLLDARNLPEVLARAFTVFSSGRPRPVCIQIPQDVLAGPVDISLEPWPAASPPGPDQATVARAADLLAQAREPLVVLGGGAAGAAPEATRLVERLDAPVINSCAGKGIVPEDHPLSLGFGQPFEPVQRALARADVVLAVGTEFAEPDRYFTPDYEIGGKLIRIDIEAGQLMQYSRPDVALLSDAKLALQAILDTLGDKTGKADVPGEARVKALRESYDGNLCQESAQHRRLLQVMHEVLPENTLISADASQVAYTGLYHYPMRQGACWHFPNGYAAMGFGVPVAVGLKVGAGDRPVVCLTGDGSFQMTLEELIAAVEQKLTLPIIVWTNGGYQEIREYMMSRQLPTIGCDIYNPDFAEIARAFGCRGLRVESAEQLRTSLQDALQAEGPTVIEVREGDPWLTQ